MLFYFDKKVVSLNINAIMIKKPWNIADETEENLEEEKVSFQFIPLGAMTFVSHTMDVRRNLIDIL